MKNKLYLHKNLPEMYNLDVDADKNISVYFEVSGKKDGIPIFFIHGGPGGQSRTENHYLFNPNIFKSIIFDQRGCGKSKPYRLVDENNTQNLVSDMEKIRKFLNLNKIYLVGGSWGATLALLYAQTYPENVNGIVLRSVFLGTNNEIDWAFVEGPKIFAPELYENFLDYLDFDEKKTPLQSFYKKIHHQKSSLHSWVWHDYERMLSQINPSNYSFENTKSILARNGEPNSPFMETHYIQNNFFIENNQIVKNIKILEDIPCIIVQGRYDLICPPINAYSLHTNWDKSKITFINTAGHSSSDEGMLDCLLKAFEEIINF